MKYKTCLVFPRAWYDAQASPPRHAAQGLCLLVYPPHPHHIVFHPLPDLTSWFASDTEENAGNEENETLCTSTKQNLKNIKMHT